MLDAEYEQRTCILDVESAATAFCLLSHEFASFAAGKKHFGLFGCCEIDSQVNHSLLSLSSLSFVCPAVFFFPLETSSSSS